MKSVLFSIVIVTILASSCIRHGAQSRYVKYQSFSYNPAVFVGDTSYYLITYKNKSAFPLIEPVLNITVKDTVKGIVFYRTLYRGHKELADIPDSTEFSVRFNVLKEFDQASINKIKFKLHWTNSEGKRSFRRSVR